MVLSFYLVWFLFYFHSCVSSGLNSTCCEFSCQLACLPDHFPLALSRLVPPSLPLWGTVHTTSVGSWIICHHCCFLDLLVRYLPKLSNRERRQLLRPGAGLRLWERSAPPPCWRTGSCCSDRAEQAAGSRRTTRDILKGLCGRDNYIKLCSFSIAQNHKCAWERFTNRPSTGTSHRITITMCITV